MFGLKIAYRWRDERRDSSVLYSRDCFA